MKQRGGPVGQLDVNQKSRAVLWEDKVKKFMLTITALILFLGAIPYEPLMFIVPPVDHGWARMPVLEESLPLRRYSEYTELFELVAGAERVPAAVLESVAFAESRFEPGAKSPMRSDGFQDMGMFQFNAKYLAWYAEQYNGGKPFDPLEHETAAVIAARHLRALREQFGSWPLAVMAYNCGASRVEADEIPESTYRYAGKVWEK
jgi:soluble lytic murein transglycosylase-like protein